MLGETEPGVFAELYFIPRSFRTPVLRIGQLDVRR